MHFIVRRLMLASAWCLCLATFHVSAEEPAGEAFVTDQPDETAAISTPQAAPRRYTGEAKPQAVLDHAGEPRSLPSEYEPFEFDGIQPGVSSITDVRNLWGEPQSTLQQTGETIHIYAREPFKQVEVTVSDEQVRSIIVALNERFAVIDVARQLELMDYEPVLLLDGAEICRGQAYPERGVTLRWASPDKMPGDAGKHDVAEIAFGSH